MSREKRYGSNSFTGHGLSFLAWHSVRAAERSADRKGDGVSMGNERAISAERSVGRRCRRRRNGGVDAGGGGTVR